MIIITRTKTRSSNLPEEVVRILIPKLYRETTKNSKVIPFINRDIKTVTKNISKTNVPIYFLKCTLTE